MIEDAGSSAFSICPICSELHKDIAIHLSTHSKEEIIESISMKSAMTSNISEQAGETTVNLEGAQNPSSSAHSLIDVIHPSHVISFNDSTSNIPVIPMLSNPVTSVPPLLSPNYQQVKNSIISNGALNAVQQYASPTLPLLYRPAMPMQNVSHTVNASPILLQNPHLSPYKTYVPSPSMNSFAISPVLNQTIQQSPVQVTKPSSSSQLHTASSSASSAVKFPPNTELINGQSQVSIMTGNSASLGQQTILCVLPYGSAVQPTIPNNGNYVFYGNNLISSNFYIPEVANGNNVNYMLPNNSSLLMANPINPSYFQSTNYVNKEFISSNASSTSIRSSGIDNASQNLVPNTIECIVTNQPAIDPNGGNMSNSLPNSELSHDYLQSGLIRKETLRSNCNTVTTEENNTSTIKIGKNITIAIPSDVLGKKERVKELINKELVRALLINDSDNVDEFSETDSVDPLYIHEKDETEDASSSVFHRSIVTSNESKVDNSLSQSSISRICSREREDDKTSINTYTVSCNPTSGGIINFSNIHINPNISASLTSDEIQCKSYHESDVNISLNSFDEPGDSYHDNNVMDLSTTSQLNPKVFICDQPSTSARSNGDEDKQFYMKVECKNKNNDCINQSLNFSSTPKKDSYFPDNTSLQAMDYSENHVLESSETMCKFKEVSEMRKYRHKPSLSKLAKPSHDDDGHSNFPSHLFHAIEDFNNVDMCGSEDQLSAAPGKLKTYYHRKRSGNTTAQAVQMPCFIADSCQLNSIPLQNVSDENEEVVDDPNSEQDNCFIKDLQENHVMDDSLSADSKDVQDSLYPKISPKMESTESNGTLAEEIMSLKASETLADSDSERASPIEEVGEIFYGKSCIFAGEPGPPHLFPGIFGHLDMSKDLIDGEPNFPSIFNSSVATFSPENINNFEQEESEIPETISVTLDANCSVFEADALNALQEVSNLEKESLICDDWTKIPLHDEANYQVDCKSNIVTLKANVYPSSLSPHASTSGLQSYTDSALGREKFGDEELYDFEYESDCYADSDSDAYLNHRVPLDIERWRCFKCKKTFKSLKEKLLHSGHHSNGCQYTSGVVNFQEEKSSIVGSCKEDQFDSKEILLPSEKHSKIGSTPKKILHKTLKMEVLEPLVNNECPLIPSMVDSKNFRCTECSATFPSIDKLYEHRANVFRSRYICPICHMEFKRRIDKIKHLKIHPESERRCLICNRSFESVYAWSQHQLIHIGLIAYECKECGYKCRRKGELVIHKRKHSGEKPYKCEICNNTFVTNNSLKRHLISHMDGQEIECDICHKKYKNAVNLNKHKLQIHSKKKKFLKKRSDFMCPICNEIFHSSKKLAWHQETHERWPKKCQICGECFIHQSNLTKHIRLKHDPAYIPEGNKDNQPCPICNKMYKKSSILQHMRIHTGDKPYKCNVCSKQFSVKCNYTSHKWVHMGVRDRPLKCKLCDKSFHRKRFLESHVRSHKKIRPYTCNECGKSFIHKCNYRTHVRQHTEEKKHECEHCGKTFHRKYNLNNHVRIHTGETPYECSICRKEFTQKSNYNVHMKAFHVERHAVHEEV